jgi:cell wall-associated NlpC family hydrolase
MGTEARKRGLPSELPIMASLVESGMKNLPGGDADSVGYFQMRVGIWNNGAYAGYPNDPKKQVDWFLDNAEAVKKQRIAAGQPVDSAHYGDWIADVERPAAQYRGRYQPMLAQARSLLDQAGSGSNSGGGSNGVQDVANFDPAQHSGVQSPTEMVSVATKVDKLGLPYHWGGGHGTTPAPIGTPVDCSGYVSQILGVSPRTSGGFMTFGDAGAGKQVTIYANRDHVLIQIGDRFFATSASNPGGGPGEIPRPSDSYLAAFVKRHPAGM